MQLSSRAIAREAAPRSAAIAYWSLAGFVIVAAIAGGAELHAGAGFIAICVAGVPFAAITAYVLRGETFSGLPWLVRLLIPAWLALPLLQLVPIPYATWANLPGHGLSAAIVAATGGASGWRAMTLTIANGIQLIPIYFWLAAVAMMTLQLSSRHARRLLLIVVGVGLLHLAVGLVQVSTGALDLYDTTYRGNIVGLLANKNHAALLFAILIVAAYFSLSDRALRDRRTLLSAIVFYLVVFVATCATFSRAGVVLVLTAALVILLAHYWWRPFRIGRRLVVLVAAAAVLAAIVLSTDLADRLLARFADVGRDPRIVVWQRSLPLVADFFPFGTGLSAFPEVFATAERLAWVKPTYVNHVHNDFIEFLIEAGLYGVVLIVGSLAALVQAFIKIWPQRATRRGRDALGGLSIVVLAAAHSAVDYPLRRMTIAVIVMVGVGLMLRIYRKSNEQLRSPDDRASAPGDDGVGGLWPVVGP